MLHRFARILSIALCLAVAAPAGAALKVLATTPDWAALATELGGERVNVYAATNPFQDVHRVEAKPSLVARARSADLVFATGAELEVGWLPVLIQESGNAHIQPGSPGYFEAAAQLRLLEVPSSEVGPDFVCRYLPIDHDGASYYAECAGRVLQIQG